MKIKRGDADYPPRLEDLPNPPPVLTTSGALVPKRAIAIVGARKAIPAALAYAFDLAYQLASAGILVISGGAVGIDGAAHRGAMAAGGATWVVSPTGKDRVYPPAHRELFEEVAQSRESRMLWPFDDHCAAVDHNMRYRNGVIAALSEALIVIQARHHSGSRNALRWARDMNRAVWAVAAPPWMGEFCGSADEIHAGRARPLCSTISLFNELGLGRPVPPPGRAPEPELDRQNHGPASKSTPLLKGPPKAPDTTSWSENEKLIFSLVSVRPMHIDKMVGLARLPVPPVATALLTLCLKDVVVEGPDGFFRRKMAG